MKNFYSPQFLYAHIGYPIALTANRNKIVFRLSKCSKTGKIKFAKKIAWGKP